MLLGLSVATVTLYTQLAYFGLNKTSQYGDITPTFSGFPIVGKDQYGYITPAFSGSPWWGEINLERSGCGGNEQKKHVKRGGKG